MAAGNGAVAAQALVATAQASECQAEAATDSSTTPSPASAAASGCEPHQADSAGSHGAGPLLKAEAKAYLDNDSKAFQMHPVTLGFRSQAIEADYLTDVARKRWPVLIFIFCFDVLSYCFRTTAKFTRGEAAWQVVREMGPQLLNMALLYTFVGVLNARSRRKGVLAARQEELLLCVLMTAAVTFLMASLTPANAQDYVLVTYFLITTTTFLKLRWHVGVCVLAAPVLFVWVKFGGGMVRGGVSAVDRTAADGFGAFDSEPILPPDSLVHITMAWAVGALMSFLNESYRRQMFLNHRLAMLVAEKEIIEMRKRMEVQRELAEAQAQAAARALCVAREKASNEAKSDFMSLMCHEVRTPLNGALASVEMLLETPLEEEQRELAKTIRVSGSILLSTVSNFLDFFKIEAGKQLDIVRTEIDIAQLVRDVHCIIEAMIGRSDDLCLMPPELAGVPATVMGDPDRLCGILLNLYTNAAKFTKRGFIALRVRACTGEYVPEPSSAEHLHQQWEERQRGSNSPHSPAAAGAAVSSATVAQAPALGAQPTPVASAAAAALALSLGVSVDRANEMRRSWSDLEQQGAGSAASWRQNSTDSASRRSLDSDGPGNRRGSLAGRTHPSHREDGLRVWDRKYPAEDGARVRRRLSNDAHDSAAAAAAKALGHEGFVAAGQPVPAAAAAALESRFVKARSSTEGEAGSSFSSSPATGPAPAAAAAQPEIATSTGAVESNAAGQHSSTNNGSASHHADQQLRPEMAPDGSTDAAGAMKVCVKGMRDGWHGVVSQRQPQPKSLDSSADAGGQGGVSSGSTQPMAVPNQPPPQQQGWLLFEVVDTGNGIPPEGLQTLFKQYEQGTDVDMRKPRRRGGTGLGLSICSKQVSVLGGRIGATSCVNKGSIFWFTIPLAIPAEHQHHHRRVFGHASLRSGRQAQSRQEQHMLVHRPPSMDAGAPGLDMDRFQAEHGIGLAGIGCQMQQQRLGTGAAAGVTAGTGYSSSAAAYPGSYAADGGPSMLSSVCSGIGTIAEDSREGHRLSGEARALLGALDASTALHPAPCAAVPSYSAGATEQRAAQSTSAGLSAPPVPEPGGLFGTAAGAGDAAGGSGRPHMGGWTIRSRRSLDRRGSIDTTLLKGKRVLLAEDNLINQTVARKMLTGLGLDCVVASNGQEAVDVALAAEEAAARYRSQATAPAAAEPGGARAPSGARAPRPGASACGEVGVPAVGSAAGGHASGAGASGGGGAAAVADAGPRPFDVVLMDMMMPTMGGVEATRTLRERGFSAPIVAMTANASDRDRDECMEAGMDGFLSKPVLKDRLAEAILAALAGHSNFSDETMPANAFDYKGPA